MRERGVSYLIENEKTYIIDVNWDFSIINFKQSKIYFLKIKLFMQNSTA